MTSKSFFLTLTLTACCLHVGAQPSSIDQMVAKMSLDEKIGQMVQLEINQVSYVTQGLSFNDLMALDEQALDKVIKQYKLQDRYDAKQLAGNSAEAYQFYLLAQNIQDAIGFKLDDDKLKKAFAEHKVGSLLNMLGGVHGADLKTWRKALSEIQASAKKHLGVPCLYGLDQVHGTTYSLGGTLFPQPIGMSATWNPDLVHRIGEICAYETRACGVPWVFVPDLDLGRNPAWSRQYEGVGEDPCLGAKIGTAYMRGFQGDDKDHIDAWHVGTCLKHFVGYGVTANGRDRVPGMISDSELREKYFAPFLAAFRAGSLSTMTNSSILNGMNGVANKRLLTGWLKEDLDWDGMIVTDWADIENLRNRDHIAATTKDGIVMAINAGVDLMMVPSLWTYGGLLKEAVEEGQVEMSRIDDAVRRILRLKQRLGLFDNPLPDGKLYPKFGSKEHADVALQAAIESEVLLKNEAGVLPIAQGKRILVCGPCGNSMRTLNGGWSYTWQGENSEAFTKSYHTIYDALKRKFGDDHVSYVAGVEWANLPSQPESERPADFAAVEREAASADVIVACVGENSYAETTGNIGNLHLSAQQTELVERLCATGKPVVLVLNQGRCRLISELVPKVSAVVDVMLPGNYGGDALAELLAGDANFSGRLPMTYPSQPHAFTTYDYKVCENHDTMEGTYNYEANAAAQWWFGEGKSYTTFSYANLRLNKTSFVSGDTLTVTLDVTNTGTRAGKEVVMLFSSDQVASLIPDNRRLRAFEKIDLAAHETRTVSLKIAADDLAFVGEDGHWVLEQGAFTLAVGPLKAETTCTATRRWETPNP